MATVTGEHSHLLNVTDVIAKIGYLIDDGAQASVLPANSIDQLHKPVFNLQAPNGKPITTYG